MNLTLISKITERGQITLPKRVRDTRLFSEARAVVFEERGHEIVIKPMRTQKKLRATNDHWPLAVHSHQDWLDAENDDLIKLPIDL